MSTLCTELSPKDLQRRDPSIKVCFNLPHDEIFEISLRQYTFLTQTPSLPIVLFLFGGDRDMVGGFLEEQHDTFQVPSFLKLRGSVHYVTTFKLLQ